MDQLETDKQRVLEAMAGQYAWRRTPAGETEWISVAMLREDAGLPRARFDAAIIALTRSGPVNLAPESNQKTLRDTDRHAAVRMGGQDKHLACIEGHYR